MRSKEFIREAGLKPLKPLASVSEPAGGAPVDQALAQADQPKGPGLLSRAWSGAKTMAGNAANRFGHGFSAGFQSGLGPGKDPYSMPGIANKADAAALEPLKYAWNLYTKQITPADVPQEKYRQVQGILRNPPKDWADHVTKGTLPPALQKQQGPQQTTIAHSHNEPVNPQVANYLKQATGGQKVNPTGNAELDRILKTAGIQ